MKISIGKYSKKGDRKVTINIDNTDLFSLDHTLALIILPAIKAYRNISNGIIWGSVMEYDKYYSNLPLTKKQKASNKKLDKQAKQKMNDILDKIIKAFELITNDNIAETEEDNEKIRDGLDLFAKYYHSLWY